MSDQTCEYCKGPVQNKNSRYCSKECYVNSRWTERKCGQCGNVFKTRKCYVERRQVVYCSRECSYIANRTQQGVFYNGVRYSENVQGYLISSEGDGRLLHRVIWEEYYGAIPDGYVIHHKNANKKDNRIENLSLEEWGSHTAYHNSTGISYGAITCKGCGKVVKRRSSEIRRGQNKFCSRGCSNKYRSRNEDGRYESGHEIL